MENSFATRMGKVKKSFIREILKVAGDPEIISFAGGLPNPALFPVDNMRAACVKVLDESARALLQYQTSEGHGPLREFIARRYRERWGFDASADEVLVTSGSQQALDLIGKIFIDAGDRVVLERPGYLGAIQALGIYEPEFVQVELEDDGMDTARLAETLAERRPKFIYTVPNFQNPSGVSYSRERREEVARLAVDSGCYIIEDDPYGELRFRGESVPPIRLWAGANCIMTGSFSKTVAPGLRVGWVYAPREVIDKLLIAKQAADLHSDSLSQRVLYQYLADNDIDEHIAVIRDAYGRQRNAMVAAVKEHCPPDVKCTEPEGGMFLWMTLPKGLDSHALFDKAVAAKVAFVPGTPFYTDGGGANTMRLNYSNSDEEKIHEGIKRLGRVIKDAVAGGCA